MASTLKERTERVLIDVAPYEHIDMIGAKTKVEPQTPTTPILQVEGVPVSPSQNRASEKSDLRDPEFPMIPSEGEIRVALTSAALIAGPESIRLPLRHRRFIMVGALLILTGGVLGLLLTWGSAITALGVALLPVGFASNGRRLGPQPLMIAAGAGALGWLVFTLWYWAPLLLGSTEPAVSPPQTVFWLGAVFFGAAWLVALRAALVRRTLRQDLRSYLARAVQDS
ncbi:hypothetical protein [Arthrobacter sp. CAL618]|uniref:hypothetical protein n=1 Tax=Arthrobacter sp. CAL618 TaxID=1055770 RepID=UPI0012EB5236|nr:hypothetical protein [Arthrobacter sp. CAL618]